MDWRRLNGNRLLRRWCVELVLIDRRHPIVIHTFLISSCIDSMLLAMLLNDLSDSPTLHLRTWRDSLSIISSFPLDCRSCRRASKRRWWRSITFSCDDVPSAELWCLCDVERRLEVRRFIVAWRMASLEMDLGSLVDVTSAELLLFVLVSFSVLANGAGWLTLRRRPCSRVLLPTWLLCGSLSSSHEVSSTSIVTKCIIIFNAQEV